ncbi:GntR family transcriptional regulator [Terrihabitans soli]|uniref:GntR family transcriptional regulator n=1 Tax=Terrihabitans soli TaxID=708113 RepID=A0A6S6QNY0_9HYPH|nr:GntR family transcriptional regulator [Terrihabitans soli]BCJ89617.1 GntR family transcriptional regulator [Terrihabitans soli]
MRKSRAELADPKPADSGEAASGLDRQADGVPLYQRVRELLRKDLARGVWKPGNMLPTELELSERFGVSPGTIKLAIMELVREGLINRRPGKGTFVTRIDTPRGFARFFGFETPGGAVLNPSVKVVELEITTEAPAAAKKALGLGARGKVLFVRRLLSHDGTPVCIYDSYLPYKLMAGLENEKLDVDRIYYAIEKKFDIHVVAVEEMLKASLVGGKEAKLLGVQAGSPVIHIERVAFSHNNTVVEWRETIGRSDQFIYKLRSH